MRLLSFLIAVTALPGCRVLTSGLASPDALAIAWDTAKPPDASGPDGSDAGAPLDTAQPIATPGPPLTVGCSDGTREGFRNVGDWPEIAGCAGAFDRTGVIGTLDLQPTCGRQAGEAGANPRGKGCSAADLCADDWHQCRNGKDVAEHSPTGDCEGSVPANELRFFLVASGASISGVCSADPTEANDLHGCGSFGQPESEACYPLNRRMGFADCLRTDGVWQCGGDSDAWREAAVVSKPGVALGGVLCCKD